VDEAFTLHYSTVDLPQLITLLKDDVHPILFYLLEQISLSVFGMSEFTLRFLPFVFGSLSIIAFFFFVRKLYTTPIALLAMALFSFSYTFILYAQEAKMYSQFMFFFFLVGIFYVRFIQSGTLADGLWLALFNSLLVHTHVLSFGIVFVEFVLYFILWKHKKTQNSDLLTMLSRKLHGTYRPSYFLLSIGFVVVSYMFWLPIFVHQFDRLFLDMLPLKFNQKFGFDGFYIMFSIFLLVVCIGSVVLYVIAGNKKWAHISKRYIQKIRVPHPLFIIIFLVFLAVNVMFHETFFGTIPYVRYLLMVVPFVYIIFAKKLFSLPSRKLFISLLCVYLIVTLFILFRYYTIDGKEQFREAAGYIMADADESDVLFLDTSIHAGQAFNYYYSGKAEQIALYERDDISVIPYGTCGRRYAYLIQSHNYQTRDFFRDELAGTYPVVEEKEWIGVNVIKYKLFNNHSKP
jgi:uncharacterized membrane protein